MPRKSTILDDDKRQLAIQEQEGHDAQRMLELLSDFDEQYTQAIISNILSCDPKDFEGWRNLLKAKEALLSYLKDKVKDGELAYDRMLEMDKEDDNTLFDKYRSDIYG